MKTKETKLGTMLKFLSFVFYEAGEGLQRAGDVLGDAGEVYDRKAPGTFRKMRRGAAAAGMWLYIQAGAIVVFLACCLQGLFYVSYNVFAFAADALPRMMGTCAKGATQAMKTGKESALKVQEVCRTAAAFLYRMSEKLGRNMSGAWTFRAELLAEAKGAAG